MIGTLLIVLVLLWLLGFLRIPALPVHDITLFRILGHTITLWEIVIFIVIAWIIEMLPSPLRQIAYILVLLWVLSILGIVQIAGLSQLLIGAIIIGVILTIFQGRR